MKAFSTPTRDPKSISLRLLALILCSNCSNTFNKVLIPMWDHTVKLLFETSGFPFSLLNISHGWSKHLTSRYDPSTPFTPPHTMPVSMIVGQMINQGLLPDATSWCPGQMINQGLLPDATSWCPPQFKTTTNQSNQQPTGQQSTGHKKQQ